VIGARYNKWTIVSEAGKDAKSNKLFLCQCDCGVQKIHRIHTLRSGRSIQCKRCYSNNMVEDIVGKKFGSATVLKRIENNRGHEAQYLVRCNCGIERKALGYKLKQLKATKCPHCRVKTHGMSNTDTFRIWQGLFRRCYNINFKHYKYYGGRGIIVCERWFKFENFLQDMGKRPPKLSIDRIDNNGNYEKNNCQWATSAQQMSNRRISEKQETNL
jgi:hypothetical protein